MRSALSVFAPLVVADLALARSHLSSRQADSDSYPNPFEGRQLYVNTGYSESLEVTRQSFLDDNDEENAGKVQFVQEQVGTFVWVSNIGLLSDIDAAIEGARSAQDETGEEQIVGLVLYDLPDRDCSAGESSGELSLADGGLERYMDEYVGPFAEKVLEADDLQFSIVLEPDAVGNMVTGQDMEICANAAEPHREAIAYAIQQLQADHVHLYIDASNGGWLGSEQHIESGKSFNSNPHRQQLTPDPSRRRVRRHRFEGRQWREDPRLRYQRLQLHPLLRRQLRQRLPQREQLRQLPGPGRRGPGAPRALHRGPEPRRPLQRWRGMVQRRGRLRPAPDHRDRQRQC